MTSVGTSVRRLEDPRLLRGRGRFVDDVSVAGHVAMRVVRSTLAHARLDRVDAAPAMQVPGAVAVLTAEDLGEVPRIPIRLKLTESSLDAFRQPVLAQDCVRYVGEPVAVVVGRDAYVCEDMAERVVVDYTPLPLVLDATVAMTAAAPRLWGLDTGNEAATLIAAYGDVDAAFAQAAHTVELDVSVGRHTAVPLETRGLLARPDRQRGHLEIWGMTKVPHFNRRVLSDALDMPLEHIHLRGCDAGGGFGTRGEFYPEDFLVPYLARRLDRPVKWVEDRSEHLVAANHSRQQRHCIAMAFDGEGRILGLRDEVWHDNGAYLRTHGVTVPELTINMLPGPYRIPAYQALVHVVTTNKTPAGTYRAPGRYEGTFTREHLLDVAARRLGVDPVELRRTNLLTATEMPHVRPLRTLGTEVILDAGDYPRLLDRALEAADLPAWRREAALAKGEGRLVGNGISLFVEKSGLGPYEVAEVVIDPTGSVRVLTGGTSLGQGIETVMAQIAADELGLDPQGIEVIHGDTDLIPDGVGSWASRSTVVGGAAVLHAASRVADKARRVAAELLGVSEEKVVLGEGLARVEGTERGVSLGEVAAACDAVSSERRSEPPGLRAHGVFAAEHMTYPYGVHLAQVEVDPATGGVRIHRYCVAYEVGKAINPQLVEGQIIGGLAQGIGGALMEELRYDTEGQPQCTTFMDYLMPTAAEMPGQIVVLVTEDAPASDNPLGVRGAGEGGTTACGGAIANAVMDALDLPDGIDGLPLSPLAVRNLITRT
jgi:aerobic carbon-monoxide dehydrogenase large subunit